MQVLDSNLGWDILEGAKLYPCIYSLLDKWRLGCSVVIFVSEWDKKNEQSQCDPNLIYKVGIWVSWDYSQKWELCFNVLMECCGVSVWFHHKENQFSISLDILALCVCSQCTPEAGVAVSSFSTGRCSSCQELFLICFMGSWKFGIFPNSLIHLLGCWRVESL